MAVTALQGDISRQKYRVCPYGGHQYSPVGLLLALIFYLITFLIYYICFFLNCFIYFLLIYNLHKMDIYSPKYGHLKFKGSTSAAM